MDEEFKLYPSIYGQAFHVDNVSKWAKDNNIHIRFGPSDLVHLTGYLAPYLVFDTREDMSFYMLAKR